MCDGDGRHITVATCSMKYKYIIRNAKMRIYKYIYIYKQELLIDFPIVSDSWGCLVGLFWARIQGDFGVEHDNCSIELEILS